LKAVAQCRPGQFPHMSASRDEADIAVLFG
jgi:hypothetical protein